MGWLLTRLRVSCRATCEASGHTCDNLNGMTAKRIYRKIERTPEVQRELKQLRERFQHERPSLDNLAEHGDITGIMAHDEYLDRIVAAAGRKRGTTDSDRDGSES